MFAETQKAICMVNLFLCKFFFNFKFYDLRFNVKIYGIYFLIILYKLNLTYVQRMRTNVMAIYYPKREKKRILHLYNECLKKRKQMHKSTKKILLKKLRNCEDVDTNLLRVTSAKHSYKC